jgi:multiple sugar transport system permease protein
MTNGRTTGRPLQNLFLPAIDHAHHCLSAHLAVDPAAVDRRAELPARPAAHPWPAWVQSTAWALPSLVMLSLWNTAGGSRMVVFLAGLQGVPTELYDAAKIDGAGAWQRFRNVTLPLISPTIFFNVVVSTIGALSVFSVAYIGTQGGPAYATYFYVYHLYTSAFQYSLMGYASALAWIFLLIVLTLTAIQFRLQSRWVYYAAESATTEDANGK